MADSLFEDPYLAGVYDVWHPRGLRDDYDFYLPRIMAAEAVLDLGCGTGTLLMEARDAGHRGRLCGLDPASGMLDRARRRSDVEWVLGELPSVGYRGEFDLILMTGHAFQAIVDDRDLRRLAASVQRALRPGGRFAFDTRNPSVRAWERWTPEHAVSVHGPDGRDVRITTEVVAPFDGRTVTFTHTFTGAHESLPQVSTSTLRFLDPAGVAALLTDAGMQIERQFGDFRGADLASGSPEIITIAVS
jgi:SAM-dependent methyltransferase